LATKEKRGSHARGAALIADRRASCITAPADRKSPALPLAKRFQIQNEMGTMRRGLAGAASQPLELIDVIDKLEGGMQKFECDAGGEGGHIIKKDRRAPMQNWDR